MYSMLITGFLGINQLQKWVLGNNSYKVISLIRTCAEVVRAADGQEDTELLENIDKVASLEVIHNNPLVNGESLFWNFGVVKSGYTDEDYNSFLEHL